MSMPWMVYGLECSDGSVYTGITNDLERRLKRHGNGKGSKFVRSKESFKLLGKIPCRNRSEALKLEYNIKHLSHEKKIELFLKGY